MGSLTELRQVYGSWLDPRPDIVEDTALWAAILAEAQRNDPFPDDPRSVFGLLHGMRCGGAQLLITETGAIRLNYAPLIKPGLWSNKELRNQWLLPAAEWIKMVFGRVEHRLSADQTAATPLQPAVGM